MKTLLFPYFTLPLFLSILQYSTAETPECQNSYPIKNTLDIVKKIIEKHSLKKSTKQDGIEWLNLLLPSEETVEVNGISYYLNSNELDPENTYFLDILRFYSVPVYVANSKQIKEWNSSAPDKTKLLSKIGRRCPNREDTLCGLECCPRRIKTIQKILAASSNGHIVFRNVTYKTSNSFSEDEEKDRQICKFDLNKDDLLKKTPSIYYSCEPNDACCTLSCYKPILNVPSPIVWRKSDLSVQFQKYKFLFLSIILFISFGIITVYNQKLMSREPPLSPPTSTVGTIRSEKSTDSDKSQKTITTVIFDDEEQDEPKTPISKPGEDESLIMYI